MLDLFYYNNKHQDYKASVIAEMVGRHKDAVVFHPVLSQGHGFGTVASDKAHGRRHTPASVCSSMERQGWQDALECMAANIVGKKRPEDIWQH